MSFVNIVPMNRFPSNTLITFEQKTKENIRIITRENWTDKQSKWFIVCNQWYNYNECHTFSASQCTIALYKFLYNAQPNNKMTCCYLMRVNRWDGRDFISFFFFFCRKNCKIDRDEKKKRAKHLKFMENDLFVGTSGRTTLLSCVGVQPRPVTWDAPFHMYLLQPTQKHWLIRNHFTSLHSKYVNCQTDSSIKVKRQQNKSQIQTKIAIECIFDESNMLYSSEIKHTFSVHVNPQANECNSDGNWR